MPTLMFLPSWLRCRPHPILLECPSLRVRHLVAWVMNNAAGVGWLGRFGGSPWCVGASVSAGLLRPTGVIECLPAASRMGIVLAVHGLPVAWVEGRIEPAGASLSGMPVCVLWLGCGWLRGSCLVAARAGALCCCVFRFVAVGRWPSALETKLGWVCANK